MKKIKELTPLEEIMTDVAYYIWSKGKDGIKLEKGIKRMKALFNKEQTKNVGFLRQWLNEDRITDVKRMVTNKELLSWFPNTKWFPNSKEKK